MPIRSIDSAIALPVSAATNAELSTSHPDLEDTVVTLFDQFRDPLLRYVLSFGLLTHDGEDIIQEIFLALFRHLQLGRSRRSLRGWVFRVAHNLALKKRYANRRNQPQEALHGVLGDNHLDPAPSAEEQLVFNERQARLLAVLRALPEQDQHCLRLRSEGLRYREIAEVLGMSLGAVSISLTRSLARLERADGR